MNNTVLPTTIDHLIIGAGPTGLGAAYRLKELNKNRFLILEASDDVGGLARSIVDEQGFTWDIGGHIQFSHYKYFDKLMLKALGKDGWFHHQRESWVWMRDKFIPYPFQNHLRYLPTRDQWHCIKGLLNSKTQDTTKPIANFKDWLHRTFGSGMTRIFLEPYNFKVWAHPLELMSFRWVGERVAVIDLKTTLANILLAKDSLSWGPNNTFAFPKNGGTGAIWKAVANLVGYENISLNTPVHRVHAKRKVVELKNGSKIHYRYLFNTTPLKNFATQITEIGAPLNKHTTKLLFSSSNIIGIGVHGQPPDHLKTKCWMYFPEAQFPFYRVTVFSNYSPFNTPTPGQTWSLMAEVSESKYKSVPISNLIDVVVRGLRSAKILERNSVIVSRWSYRTKYGYPIPSLKRDEALAAIHKTLEPFDIYSRGRFGGWKYEVSNQDHSVMQGVEWANRMILGTPEETYPPMDLTEFSNR